MKIEKHIIATRYGDFYAAISYSARDKIYFVSIPAFPGVLTEAESLLEAKKFAREITELQCLAALDEGKMVVDDTRRVYGNFVRSGALAVAA